MQKNTNHISNVEKSYDLKSKQVDALTTSIGISNDLFKNARADYLELLMPKGCIGSKAGEKQEKISGALE